MARGVAQLSNNGATFPNLVGNPELGNTGFPILGSGNVLGIPIVIWIMILLRVWAHLSRVRRHSGVRSTLWGVMNAPPSCPASM